MVVHQRRRLMPQLSRTASPARPNGPPRPVKSRVRRAPAATAGLWRLGSCPALLIELPGQLDESNAAQIKADLVAAAERHPAVLVADMSGTRWCDWAGAGALAAAFGRATAAGTQLRLVLTDESVRRVLSVNGLDRLIPVYADVATASAKPAG